MTPRTLYLLFFTVLIVYLTVYAMLPTTPLFFLNSFVLTPQMLINWAFVGVTILLLRFVSSGDSKATLIGGLFGTIKDNKSYVNPKQWINIVIILFVFYLVLRLVGWL